MRQEQPNFPITSFLLKRAPYASDPVQTRGRLITEKENVGRSPFQRDRERIIHSRAFRRLKHKTQVFIAVEGDHYRTRLTHTLEVSQIARALARFLHLDEDLAETIALAHDLGHPPFGHVGEDALNGVMKNYGGFDHNAQALHIVTKLEDRYIDFQGLNLTWESLEGIAKHNGPLIGSLSRNKPLARLIKSYDQTWPLALDKFASLEAQCAAIADDIAYNAHDIDDGLRAGILTLNMLQEACLPRDILQEIQNRHPKISERHCACELARRQISLMIDDVVNTTQKNLEQLAPKTLEDIYNAKQSIVTFSKDMAEKDKQLKEFLYKNLYLHEKLQPPRQEAEKIIQKLFESYMNEPKFLPQDLTLELIQDDNLRAQAVCDFLSGMTDNYAQKAYSELKQ